MLLCLDNIVMLVSLYDRIGNFDALSFRETWLIRQGIQYTFLSFKFHSNNATYSSKTYLS
jgi:hypothetical protein